MRLLRLGLAALVLLGSAARARAEGEDERDEDGHRHAMTDDEKIAWYCKKHQDEGAGCENHARLLLPYISDYAQYDNVDVRGYSIRRQDRCAFSPMPEDCPGSGGGGGGGGSRPGPAVTGPLTADPDIKGNGKVLTFPTWSSAQALRDGKYGRFILNYNGYGQGTTFAFGFKPQSQVGLWSWVEHVDSTEYCLYEGWISRKPGGPALGKTPGPCGVDTSNSFGSSRGWQVYTKVEIDRFKGLPPMCALTTGGQYYFNLKLVKWGGNPHSNNVYSCIEYVQPNGDGSYYKN